MADTVHTCRSHTLLGEAKKILITEIGTIHFASASYSKYAKHSGYKIVL